VFERPSLPNLSPSAPLRDVVAFDSQRPYPSAYDLLVPPSLTAASAASDAEEEEEEEKEEGGEEERRRRKGAAVAATAVAAAAAAADVSSSTEAAEGPRIPPLPPSRPRPPSLPQIRLAARLLQEAFKLQLFGFDVIVPSSSFPPSLPPSSSPSSCSASPVNEEGREEEGGREGEGELLIVDVNFFPSFKEVEDFPARLRRFLREKTRGRRGEGGRKGGREEEK